MAFDGPTRPHQEADVDVLTLTEDPYSLIVWNDEVNTFEPGRTMRLYHSLPGQIRRKEWYLRRIETPMRCHYRARDRRYYRDRSRLTQFYPPTDPNSCSPPQKP